MIQTELKNIFFIFCKSIPLGNIDKKDTKQQLDILLFLSKKFKIVVYDINYVNKYANELFMSGSMFFD